MNKKIALQKSKKKSRWLLNTFADESEDKIPQGSIIEIKGNKTLCLEGCYGVSEYTDKILKLKLQKGYLTLYGAEFLITHFENRTITVKGKIFSLEFSVARC